MKKIAAALILLLFLPLSNITASHNAEVFISPMTLLFLEESTEANITVIITYKEDESEHGKAAIESSCIQYHHYSRLSMSCAMVSKSMIEALKSIKEIEGIYLEEYYETYLDSSAPYIGANVVWNTYGDIGKGATVLIIDTGIDSTHPDLRGRIIQNAAPLNTGGIIAGYVENVPNTDADGHGTHVCGIVAGTGYAFGPNLPTYHKYRGIAHGASIVGFGAGYGSENSSLGLSALLEGFNYALEKKDEYNVRIISNSWGSSGEFDPKHPIAKASFECYKAGMTVFFAAGNEGPGEHTMNRHCMAPWVMAVAAGDLMNNIADFSSRGGEDGKPYEHPDITAPGVRITSAKALLNINLNLAQLSETALYATMSGTSTATPHVSGVAALLISANPELSPDQVYDIITATANPMNYPEWIAGSGYVNALEAYRLAVKTEGNRTSFLAGNMKYGGPASGDYDYSQDPVTVGYGKQTSPTYGENMIIIGDLVLDMNILIVFLALLAILIIAAFRIKKD